MNESLVKVNYSLKDREDGSLERSIGNDSSMDDSSFDGSRFSSFTCQEPEKYFSPPCLDTTWEDPRDTFLSSKNSKRATSLEQFKSQSTILSSEENVIHDRTPHFSANVPSVLA